MQQKTMSIIFLVLGLIIGIGGTLFFGGDRPMPATITAHISPAELKNSATTAEKQIQGKIDSLVLTNITLTQKAGNTTAALQRAKKDNSILLEMVDTLLAHAQTVDTAARLAQCDSLTLTVQDLITSENLKDSLYEDLTINLQMQVSKKDSVIDFQQQQYNCLKTFFNEGINQQQVLHAENLLLDRQVKRHKVNNKLLTAGIMLLSGCTAYTFLHH